MYLVLYAVLCTYVYYTYRIEHRFAVFFIVRYILVDKTFSGPHLIDITFY